jgi:hypothetical protein
MSSTKRLSAADILSDPDVKSQVDYAVYKYGGNLPPSVARAEAERLAVEAMQKYTKSKGGIRTYLSGALKKMSRIGYKASSIMKMPESRMISKTKINDFIDEYRDTHGVYPSIDIISKHTGTKESDVINYLNEGASLKTESAFENFGVGGPEMSEEDIVKSVSPDLRGLAEDIYLRNVNKNAILKKHKIGRTTFFARKKQIDSQIRNMSSGLNTLYR